MYWLFNKQKRFDWKSSRFVRALGLDCKRNGIGQFTVRVPIDRGYLIRIHNQDSCVHFIGLPGIAFCPKAFPWKLLAWLLIRNSELKNGAWHLVAEDGNVTCRFCCVVPMNGFNRASTKRAIETTLSEITSAKRKYQAVQSV
jgi:hypothetical protein